MAGDKVYDVPLDARAPARRPVPVGARGTPQPPSRPPGTGSPRRPPAGARTLTHRLAAVLRADLDALADQIVRDIRTAIPDCARLGEGRYGRAMRDCVVDALRLYVDLVEDPGAARDKLGEVCRLLGRAEAREGRPLDVLHQAYRVAARTSWRWIMTVGARHHLPSPVMSRLAEMLLTYVDDLSTLSLDAYREAEAEIRGSDLELRRELIRLILDGGPSAGGGSGGGAQKVAELARVVGWPVPERVALVAVEARPDLEPGTVSTFGADALADLRLPEPHLLVPDPVDAQRQRRIGTAVGGAHVAIGPPVPLDRAGHSLRWARQTLRLVRDGVLADQPVTACADHLTTLWLLTDEDLLEQVGRRTLAALTAFGPKQRGRLAHTLFVWLQSNGNIREIASRLTVHPQTVRYRMRQLQDVLGDDLHDPDARFEMEAALRAARLRAGADPS
jgi:PucR C-terminal helix-turn-helix domain